MQTGLPYKKLYLKSINAEIGSQVLFGKIGKEGFTNHGGVWIEMGFLRFSMSEFFLLKAKGLFSFTLAWRAEEKPDDFSPNS